MSRPIADRIAPSLPYLRRYARALCGTQDGGDAFVLATLEAIIADRSLFRDDLDPRVALYRTFVKVWGAMPMNGKVEKVPVDMMSAAERHLEQITPLPRQAFLLTALEEFRRADVALILDRPPAEIDSLVDAAGKEIGAQLSARVMIIEDEPMIALDIETLITDLGHTCVGIATTRKEAVVMARRTSPGIILSDIQLADGSSGLDAVADITKEISVPVIFITAYPERLLTGDRVEPAFLIAKPFQPSMVKAVVSQALFFDVKARSATRQRA